MGAAGNRPGIPWVPGGCKKNGVIRYPELETLQRLPGYQSKSLPFILTVSWVLAFLQQTQ
eukprot:scaffold107014_cov17-Tisochrysis_lutea.AAC.1